MTPDEKLAFIRDVERAGEEFLFRVSTVTDLYLLTIQHQGWRETFSQFGSFPFEEAERTWDARKRRAVCPQERRSVTSRVSTRIAAASPQVAAEEPQRAVDTKTSAAYGWPICATNAREGEQR